MRVTRIYLLASLIVTTLIFWVPAYFLPVDTRNAVNASYCVLSIVTAFTLIDDLWDIWRTNGDGISWQAALGKLGIFLITTSFAAAAGWSLLIGLKGFPTDLVTSPVGYYFRYMQGIGLGCLFLGLSDPVGTVPRINAGLTSMIVLVCGIVIGFALGHIPINIG